MPDNTYFRKLTDREILARCIYGEARGESLAGKLAVAHVVLNRRRDARQRWGKTVSDVCLQPLQFSCFNGNDPNRKILREIEIDNRMLVVCRTVASLAIEGLTVDPTRGATHYHSTAVTPAWAKKILFLTRIGRHLFYREQ